MIILLDMDEILADLLNGINAHFNQLHDTDFTRDDYKTYKWWETWKCSYAYADKICHGYVVGDTQVHPVPGAVEGIKQLRDHNLVVVTSRKTIYKHITETWLQENFGDAFDSIYLMNQYGQGNKGKKSTIARKLGAGLAIDDQISHAKDYSSVGVPCLILDCPWNQEALPELAKRVYSWDEIVKEVNDRAS